MEQIQQEKLIVQVTETDIMRQMRQKILDAGVDEELNLFIVKDDPEVMNLLPHH